MRRTVSTIFLTSATLLVVSCGGGSGISSAGSSNPGYGPFDRNGNYVEEWADTPAKKHWWGRKAPETPVTKEQPVVAAVKPKPKLIIPTKPTYTGREVASLDRINTPTPRPTTTYTPPPRPTVTYTPPPPKPKPKPKPVAVKPQAPPPKRHVVVKGDTLYNISRPHSTSVTSIQKANGISGTTIRLGQTLIIPR